MNQNTKFEVSTMSKLEGDGSAKAIATIVVNGEFAVHGVKVVEGKDGLFAALPSVKQENGEYKYYVYPAKGEADEVHAAIDEAVLGTYEKLAESSEKNIKIDIKKPEQPISKISLSMNPVASKDKTTIAAGKMMIDDCLIVTDVKVNEIKKDDGSTKLIPAMPSKSKDDGYGGKEYDDIAHAITPEFAKEVNKALVSYANNLIKYKYEGAKYNELGGNPVRSTPMPGDFADKLMTQLDKAGIVYQARREKEGEQRVEISVRAEDRQKFEKMRIELRDKEINKDKPQKKPEQTTAAQKPEQKKTAPKKGRAR